MDDEKRFYHILRFLQHIIFGTIGLEMEHVHSNPPWRMIFHSASILLTFLNALRQKMGLKKALFFQNSAFYLMFDNESSTSYIPFKYYCCEVTIFQ